MKYLLVMGCTSRLCNAFFYAMTIQGLAAQYATSLILKYIYIGRSYKWMFQLEYLFNGTLQILAIRITVENGNQSSLPKTFICVVAILFETINVTCCDTCILNSL